MVAKAHMDQMKRRALVANGMYAEVRYGGPMYAAKWWLLDGDFADMGGVVLTFPGLWIRGKLAITTERHATIMRLIGIL